ncbi:myosin phosphatase Rho-interacting protein-like [Coregonus clupeaformis]|uniref:myosin phosphatase Rho-interacting protein-like n=1 Tax=Coregonus clupeaformis TaxID=59861 RepID=UPI001E1C4A66|nr:myosin phosphatase Rho-interacting protein-like [Coregonus clupeaformis]
MTIYKVYQYHVDVQGYDVIEAKSIYVGWLLLAPAGLNFANPAHKTRRQRRFFVLHEHGVLRYALDDMPSILPQGSINMNQCWEVVDGEQQTGQRNTLCLCLFDNKETYLRGGHRRVKETTHSIIPQKCLSG